MKYEDKNKTVEFYERNAKEFIRNTQNLDLSHLYEPFLRHIPEGGSILDAGCGSGRDSLMFMKWGYEVTAFDNSPAMVEAASHLLGQKVYQLPFEKIAWRNTFDGIWACASLLHVPLQDMTETFQVLISALKYGGVLYASFKAGEGELYRTGRLFTSFTSESLEELLHRLPSISIIHCWKTADNRPDREGEFWINVLIKKVNTWKFCRISCTAKRIC